MIEKYVGLSVKEANKLPEELKGLFVPVVSKFAYDNYVLKAINEIVRIRKEHEKALEESVSLDWLEDYVKKMRKKDKKYG